MHRVLKERKRRLGFAKKEIYKTTQYQKMKGKYNSRLPLKNKFNCFLTLEKLKTELGFK